MWQCWRRRTRAARRWHSAHVVVVCGGDEPGVRHRANAEPYRLGCDHPSILYERFVRIAFVSMRQQMRFRDLTGGGDHGVKRLTRMIDVPRTRRQ